MLTCIVIGKKLKLPVGNKFRDMWKATTWEMAKEVYPILLYSNAVLYVRISVLRHFAYFMKPFMWCTVLTTIHAYIFTLIFSLYT